MSYQFKESVNNFYVKLLETLKIEVDESGYLYVGDEKNLLTQDTKLLVLPTRENISSMYAKNDDGVIEQIKFLFNPLNEDIVAGGFNKSVMKIKSITERLLGHSFSLLVEQLLQLASDKKYQKDISIELTKVLGKMKEDTTSGIKKIIDNNSTENFIKIYTKTLEQEKGMFSIYLKKVGTIDNKKYIRTATLSSSVYEMLCNKESSIYGIKLRNKDIAIYKILFEYLLPGIENGNSITIGSNDGVAPTFVSVYELFYNIANRFNKVVKEIEHLNVDVANQAKFNLNITLSELHTLSDYSSDLKEIPSENKSINSIASQQDKLNNIINTDVNNTNRHPNSNVAINFNANVNTKDAKSGDEALAKILNRNNNNISSYNNYIPQQSMNINTNVGGYQPVTTGYSPMYQQPTYQPMFQQSIVQPQPLALNTISNNTNSTYIPINPGIQGNYRI